MNDSLADWIRSSTILGALIFSLPLVAHSQQRGAMFDSPPPKVAPSSVSLETYVRRYESDANGISRFYNVQWSEARFDRLAQFYRAETNRLKEVDFNALDQPGRVDYLLLRNKLTEELAHLALEQRELAEMKDLLPFRHPVQDLELARRRMEAVNSKASAEIVAAIPDEIKKLRARIKKLKSDKTGEKAKGDGKVKGAKD